MYELKSAILSIFQKGLGWPCPVSVALKNASYQLKNSFCFGCQCIPRKLKLLMYSFMLKHSKIKQCDCFLYVWTLPHISIKTCLPKMKISRLALRSKTKHARLRSSLSGLCTSRGIPHGTTLALLICVHNDWLLDSLASLHITRMSVV